MIIKHADDSSRDIDELNALLALPYVDKPTKQKIQEEIRKIRSGIKGENDAAYAIDFYLGDHSKNWAVIHDLRVEYEGRVAQIDHLLINRLMEIYICESKNFNEGVAVNEYGEFSYYYSGKAYGIPSPIEQNERHRLLLNKMFDDGEIELPTRLGMKMKPLFFPLILIGNSAQIDRPESGKKFKHVDKIIKAEQIRNTINKNINKFRLSDFSRSLQMLPLETLYDFAENIAAAHIPIKRDWKKRFGIIAPAPQAAVPKQAQAAPQAAVQPAVSEAKPKPASKRPACADCGKTLTQKNIDFCQNDKTRFQGRVYCFNCQKNHP